jgi:DNA invertase Pin-like site-specific DNA recombinase
MSKRAALYMRVSTLDQHPETQLHDLRLMARQRGYEIVCEYVDKISGTRAKRPGLDELLHDARRGRFDIVMVWAFDRMARSVRHFLEVLDELTRSKEHPFDAGPHPCEANVHFTVHKVCGKV